MAASHVLLRLTPTFREVEEGRVQAQFVELPASDDPTMTVSLRAG